MSSRVTSLSKTGILFGIMGLGITLFQFFIGPINSGNFSFNIDYVFSISSVVLAFVAILVSLALFIKKVDGRYSAVIASLGIATLAIHFILITIGIVVIFSIIFFVFLN